MMMILLGND